MLDAIGDFLPAAVGVALSPFPIIAIVLVLNSSRASANGIAFAFGWVAGLSAATAIVVLLTDGTDDPTSETSTVVAWTKVAIGIALLWLAGKKWRTRPLEGDVPTMPRWMASLDSIHPPRALLLGAVLAGANPKNLAFTFAAASSIAAFGLTGADAAITGGVYVAVASSTVLSALLAHLVAGARSEAPLETVKGFMLANNQVIIMVILLVLGATVLGDGLAGI